jgi:hypothetical protein
MGSARKDNCSRVFLTLTGMTITLVKSPSGTENSIGEV